MIFAGSDSEMISKLAKSIAHFFVVQNITEESKEVIYAYGMELLISDVLNTISFIMIALPIILCIAPVPHPNKPMSEEKSVKLRKRSCILAVTLSVVTIALLVFQYQKLSLYVSSGMLLSAIMALLGHFLNRGDNSKR